GDFFTSSLTRTAESLISAGIECFVVNKSESKSSVFAGEININIVTPDVYLILNPWARTSNVLDDESINHFHAADIDANRAVITLDLRLGCL
ncbi:MAG TPA: hypothetical protein DCY36_05345, partial [Acidimicrobiaceae bacterium]|nr:hypothetical protein [Acidimicrobiaceae bacterium]